MDKTNNIISILKQDHKALKEGIQVLISEIAKPSQKKSVLKKFITDLKLHSEAEEKSLYDDVVNMKEVRENILESYEEHALAILLADELEAHEFESDFSEEYQAKAKVLAELVKHHIDEEEIETFPEIKKLLSPEKLIELGNTYREVYTALNEDMLTSRTRIKRQNDSELPGYV